MQICSISMQSQGPLFMERSSVAVHTPATVAVCRATLLHPMNKGKIVQYQYAITGPDSSRAVWSNIACI